MKRAPKSGPKSAPKSAVVCFGEVLLRLGTPAGSYLLQSPVLHAYVGGAEANVAASLSRFGHHVRMVSALPDNSLGDAAIAELQRYGVDVSSVQRSAGRMGLYFLEEGGGLRRSEVTYDRAGSVFAGCGAATFSWSAELKGARWLHLSGITPALGAGPAAAALEAAQAARKANIGVSFDGNYRDRLWAARGHRGKAVLAELLGLATVAFVNDRDISLLLGQEFEGETAELRVRAAARVAFDHFPGLQTICCTLRSSVTEPRYSGVLVSRRRSLCSQSYSLRGAVDRIGSGDAFAAGTLHGLLSRWSEQRTLEFGVAAGALKHGVQGDFNVVTADQVAQLVEGGSADVRR